MKINWTHNKEVDEYFSDRRYEFVIYKEGNFWILSYTDFWSSEGHFFVHIKNSSPDMFAIPQLKMYGQVVANLCHQYLESKNLRENKEDNLKDKE